MNRKPENLLLSCVLLFMCFVVVVVLSRLVRCKFTQMQIWQKLVGVELKQPSMVTDDVTVVDDFVAAVVLKFVVAVVQQVVNHKMNQDLNHPCLIIRVLIQDYPLVMMGHQDIQDGDDLYMISLN